MQWNFKNFPINKLWSELPFFVFTFDSSLINQESYCTHLYINHDLQILCSFHSFAIKNIPKVVRGGQIILTSNDFANSTRFRQNSLIFLRKKHNENKVGCCVDDGLCPTKFNSRDLSLRFSLAMRKEGRK